MHTRMLVTLPLTRAKTSAGARRCVFKYLVEEGFIAEGRFAGGCADWFVIGGRWSGCLSGSLEERDDYADLGREDDAMVLTDEIYDKHLKEHEGESESEYYCDVDCEP